MEGMVDHPRYAVRTSAGSTSAVVVAVMTRQRDRGRAAAGGRATSGPAALPIWIIRPQGAMALEGAARGVSPEQIEDHVEPSGRRP